MPSRDEPGFYIEHSMWHQCERERMPLHSVCGTAAAWDEPHCMWWCATCLSHFSGALYDTVRKGPCPYCEAIRAAGDDDRGVGGSSV